ncbi:development-specific protein LVN1.2-like [Amphiura filiformis]|uniref:development-specific protein LVN1.2-like n=1 Tax=Amphiura filiformis TaxID=82378 RepID=UPI003B212086
MLYILLIIIAVVTTATAIAQAAEPKKCCFPDQYTVLKGSTIATFTEETKAPLALYEAQDIAFDYTNGRIGYYANYTFFSGQDSQSTRVVEDMAKKLLWVIDPIKKQCTKSSLADFNTYRCIPENATYIGKSYFGDKSLYMDTWMFNTTDYLETAGLYSIAVDSNGCIPIGDSFNGKSTGAGVTQDVVSTSGYTNFELGIRDPDKYFKLPDYCKQVNNEPSKLLGLLQQTKL